MIVDLDEYEATEIRYWAMQEYPKLGNVSVGPKDILGNRLVTATIHDEKDFDKRLVIEVKVETTVTKIAEWTLKKVEANGDPKARV
jgi:hypothetical protein